MTRPQPAPIPPALPDPKTVNPVRTGPGGAWPEVQDITLRPLNPGDPDRPQGPAGPVPSGDGAGMSPIRQASPDRRWGNPDLSEEKSPEALPSDAPAAPRS